MMLSFVFAVMLLVCLVVLLWPLGKQGAMAPNRQEYDLAIYRDQLAELERDAARGLLPPDQMAAARTEIQRRVLASAALPEIKVNRFSTRLLVTIVSLFVVLGSVCIYGYLGSPELPGAPFAGRNLPESETNVGGYDFQQNIMIHKMVERLAAKLQLDPNDLEGWQRLARSYRVLGENEKAEQAEREVERLKKGRP